MDSGYFWCQIPNCKYLRNRSLAMGKRSRPFCVDKHSRRYCFIFHNRKSPWCGLCKLALQVYGTDHNRVKPLIHLISKPHYPIKCTVTAPQDILVFFRSEKSWFIYYSSPVPHTILKVNSSSWVIGRKITSLVVVGAVVVGLATTFVKFCDRKVYNLLQ